MLTSHSILSRFANRLFGRNTGRNRLRRADLRRRDHAPVYCAAEVMEERALLSAAAVSAVIGVGPMVTVNTSTVDQSGDQIVAGYFKGTQQFDPAGSSAGIVTAGGTGDIYVAKYAADGSFLSVTQMAGASGSSGIAFNVTTDSSGDIYLGGKFSGTVSFGTTVLSASDQDGFVARVSASGNVLWAQAVNGTGAQEVDKVTVDASGNVVAAGYNGSNSQIEKYDSSGTPLWSAQFGSTSGGTATTSGLALDSSGNIYVCGGFTGTVDFNPGAGVKNVTAGPNSNGYVLKLSSSGAFGWVSPFLTQNSSARTGTSQLAIASNGNIVVGGYYRGSVDFDPGNRVRTLPYSTSGSNVYGGGFITTLNSSGSLVRAFQAGDGWSSVGALTLDASDNVYVTGNFQGADTGAPSTEHIGTASFTTMGGVDMFAAKWSSTGVFQWAVTLDGTGSEFASNGINMDSFGNVYISGSTFSPDLYFGGTTAILNNSMPGKSKGFMIKLTQS